MYSTFTSYWEWLARSKIMSFGVIALMLKLSVSDEMYVNGRLFTVFTTSDSAVDKTSKFGNYVSTRTFKPSFTDLTIRSQAPPRFGAAGQLNTHSTPLIDSLLSISLLSKLSMKSLNALSAPTKFEPLSENIFFRTPHKLMNRVMAIIADVVVNDDASSTWIVLVVKQVKIAPQVFSNRRPYLTMIGPK